MDASVCHHHLVRIKLTVSVPNEAIMEPRLLNGQSLEDLLISFFIPLKRLLNSILSVFENLMQLLSVVVKWKNNSYHTVTCSPSLDSHICSTVAPHQLFSVVLLVVNSRLLIVKLQSPLVFNILFLVYFFKYLLLFLNQLSLFDFLLHLQS